MVESGVLDRVTGVLDEAGVAWSVFADTVPDPTSDVVGAGAMRLREGGFDGMIALGGGSPMDTAKAMGVLATHGGAMRDYKVPAPDRPQRLPADRHSDYRGHGVGSDAVYGHHGYEDRREDAVRRPRLRARRGAGGLHADAHHAVAPHGGHRHRHAHPMPSRRTSAAGETPTRTPWPCRAWAWWRATSAPPARSRTTPRRARR